MAALSPLCCGRGGRYSLLLCLLLLVLVGQTSIVRSQSLGELHTETQVEGCEEEERSFDSEVRVATLQFGELQIEFLVVVFILVVVLAKLGESTTP